MNVLQWLGEFGPALPLSIESGKDAHKPMSKSELRRHIQQGAVLINGKRVTIQEEIEFPVSSLVFFPKSATKRTTLI